MFNIRWEEKTLDFLNKLEIFISKRIVKKVRELKENPFSKVKRLKGRDEFVFRVGDYRIMLEVNVKNKLISILKIGHRKNIYKRGV